MRFVLHYLIDFVDNKRFLARGYPRSRHEPDAVLETPKETCAIKARNFGDPMGGMMKKSFFAAICLTLSGCIGGTPVFSEVAKFDALPTAPQGIKLALVPLNDQEGDIEFSTYRQTVKARMEAQGFQIVEDPTHAELWAFFDYGVGDPRSESFSYPIFGQTGGGTTYHSGTVNSSAGSATFSGTSTQMPSFGFVGSGNGTRTVYDRFFVLEIVDPSRSTQEKVEIVYRSNVRSSGSSGTFLPISECVFEAVFEEFRGTGSKKITGRKCFKG
ncbi:DUF4136 domain-containing protein [Altererythrobacter aurantiacus]|uniref:DUF4136 domain-containing protein n=1 Tax=Parapontixanthobacter aurantiacus TaxID=1463599 RepID=A0A844Z9H8_9SPHN|nr:DUF4136 domain-containing protein [Parapontixanthobacter aurantiacus]